MARPRIEPKVWRPLRMPDRARQSHGPEPFPPMTVLPVGGKGPEDVVADGEGRIYTGVQDGRILRISPDSRNVSVVADTGGRPLGLEVLADGRLLVCDCHRGLLRIDPASGTTEVLVGEVSGERLRFCSNAAAAADGAIYFTDSTRRFGFEFWMADILEHSDTGRLLRRDPDGSVVVLLDGLSFANGVTLAADESFLIFAETTGYRLSRYWLTGEKAGRSEVIADNLPGSPDNISRGSGGTIWVAIPSARDARLDLMLGLNPVIRKAMWALPPRLQAKARRTVWVLGVGQDGSILRDLQAPGTDYSFVTGVCENGGKLYLGSITERAIAVLALPSAPG
jgi:sugar lactone lactonase YvrE